VIDRGQARRCVFWHSPAREVFENLQIA